MTFPSEICNPVSQGIFREFIGPNRGRADTNIYTGLEGQLYLKVIGPPLNSLALINIIKMSDFYDPI